MTRNGVVEESLWYDPSGNLMYRRSGLSVWYYVGEQATVTGQLGATCASDWCAPDPASIRVNVHVLFGGARIATMRTSPGQTADQALGNVLYYHRDRQESVVATTVSGGQVGAQYRYGPYGEVDEVLGNEAWAGSELGYTGGLKLSGTLLHLEARVYDSGLRRFMQADTVDPLRYTYTMGDPANLVDPGGRKAKGPPSPSAPQSSAGTITYFVDEEGNIDVCVDAGDGGFCVGEQGKPYQPPTLQESVVNTGRGGATTSAVSPGFVDLYIRVFAPWARFGGGFKGDNRGFTTDLKATSRMWGKVTVNLQTGAISGIGKGTAGTSCAGPPCSWVLRGEKVADVRLTVASLGEGVSTITLAGANPFIGFPDIDVSLALQVRQGFLSATLRGDAFPYTEVFAVGQSGPKMLLTYRTLGGPTSGPAVFLPGANSVWMGTFHSYYP